jgi:hypothetical protein
MWRMSFPFDAAMVIVLAADRMIAVGVEVKTGYRQGERRDAAGAA